MKKIYGLFATAVILVGITACSDGSGILTVDEAVSASQKSNNSLVTAASLSLDNKTSDSIYAKTYNTYSIKGGQKNETVADPMKDDLLKSLKLKSSDESVCTVTYVPAKYKSDGTTIDANAGVRVTGVSKGNATVTVSAGDKTLASLNVKIEEAAGLIFAGDDILKATQVALDGVNYFSATDLTYQKGEKFGTVKESDTKVNTTVINGNPGYKVTGDKDNQAIEKGDLIGEFVTTVTASEKCKISEIIYTVGSTSFNVTGKVSVTKDGSKDADYTTSKASTASKGYTGTDTPNIELEKDKKATIKVSVYADASKAANAGINFGLGKLIIKSAK